VRLLEVIELKTDIRRRTSTVHPVDGVTFSVEAGETLGLVGESGCGKTITAMSVLRLLPPGGHIVGGAVQFEGSDLTTASDDTMREIRGNDIGVVFQDPMSSLNPTMRIGRQIAESVRLHRGSSTASATRRAVEVLGLVGMPKPQERLDDFPHQLSGGLRQRVMIAMALVCEPKLLIADEPTTALDVTTQAQILELLDELKTALGMAMILVTHDMGVIANRTDRVAVMYSGRIVESAETGALFGRMRHPYTEALFASIPHLQHDRNRPLFAIPGVPPDLTNPPAGCRFAPRCRFASDECREHDPPMSGQELGHRFWCFHPRSASADQIVGAGARSAGAVESGAVGSTAHRESAERSKLVIEDGGHRTGRTGEAAPDEAGAGNGVVPLLQLRNVSRDFPVRLGGLRRQVGMLQAVTDVTLAVRRGETFGLVGESGCGKTTLGRLMVGLDSPTSGEVRFDGTDLATLRGARLRSFRRNVHLMFQDPYSSLDPRMRVDGIVREPLAIQRSGDKNAQRVRVSELLAEVGLPADATGRYPHEFSGGQRQRIGLARALSLNPRLIVADEPVSALDVSIRSQILNLMKSLQALHGLTYVVISHDLSVLRYLADRIGVMYLGRLMEVGTAEQIYGHPAHPYTASLLESIPVLKPDVERVESRVALRGELPSSLNPPSGCRFRTRCPHAQDQCAEVVPDMRRFGTDQLAACHFPLRPADPPIATPSGK
jgi:peptide/nickel transport system ATP-binding protein